MPETLEADAPPLDQHWEAALQRVDGVVARHNPEATAEERAELSEATQETVHNLAESKQLKFVLTTLDKDRVSRTIEPDWAETPGFGLPASVFAEIMV